MADEDIIRQHAVELAVIAEKLKHHEDNAEELREAMQKLTTCVDELKAAVEHAAKTGKKSETPVFFGQSVGSLKDRALWLSLILVILYSMGFEIPHDALIALLTNLGKA